MPAHAVDATALWIVAAHAIDATRVAPILAILSPTKRCGKSRLLTLVARMVPRALTASNITPAAIFRVIQQCAPTLLIDEADTFITRSEEIRGVLNSGHTREAAFVVRCVGDDFEPRQFSTWGFKVVAMIGKLPDTLADRAIAVQMKRRLATEAVADVDATACASAGRLARRCARFVKDHRRALTDAQPERPVGLHDRAADNWRPLLAVADAGGPLWGARARAAARALTTSDQETASLRIELLRDIRDILDPPDDEGRRFGVTRIRIGSQELVEPDGRQAGRTATVDGM